VIDKTPRGNTQPSDHAPVVVNLAWDEETDASDDDWP
jgi:exodeoxyribonuclease-3